MILDIAITIMFIILMIVGYFILGLLFTVLMGVGILIIVGVALETMRQLESSLVNRSYNKRRKSL